MTIGKRCAKGAWIAALLLAAITTPSADAQGPTPAKPPRSQWGDGLVMGLPLGALNLTAEQERRMSETLSAYQAETVPLIRQLRQAQSALADKLFVQGSLETADLQAELQEITRRRIQLLELSARAMVDVRNLLTPQQILEGSQVRKRLGQLRSEMRLLLQPDR